MRRSSRSGKGWLPWIILLAVMAGGTALAWPTLKGLRNDWLVKRDCARAAEKLQAAEWREAALLLFNAEGRRPESPDVWRLKAELYERIDHPETVYAAGRALYLDPQSADRARNLLRVCLARRDAVTAEREIGWILRTFPQDADIWHLTGLLIRLRGSPGLAAASLSQAVKLDPTNPVFRTALASLQLDATDPAVREQAWVTLDACRLDPQAGPLASAALAGAVTPTNAPRAIAVLDDTLTRHPDFWQARVLRFAAQRTLGTNDLPAAVAQLWDAATTPAQQVEALAAVSQAAGPAQAERCWRSLSETSRLEPALRELRLGWLADKGDFNAVARFAGETAPSGFPEPARAAFLCWGVLAESQLKNAGSASALRLQLVPLVQRDPALGLSCGMRFERWGMTEDARTYYELATTGSPRTARQALVRLEQFHGRRNDLAGQIDAATRLLKLEPDNGWLANNLAAYLIAADREPVRALELARQAARLLPDSPEPRDTLALALAVNGQLDEALATHQALSPDSANVPTIRIGRALVMKLAGRPAEAASLVAGLSPADLPAASRQLLTRVTTP